MIDLDYIKIGKKGSCSSSNIIEPLKRNYFIQQTDKQFKIRKLFIRNC